MHEHVELCSPFASASMARFATLRDNVRRATLTRLAMILWRRGAYEPSTRVRLIIQDDFIESLDSRYLAMRGSVRSEWRHP